MNGHLIGYRAPKQRSSYTVQSLLLTARNATAMAFFNALKAFTSALLLFVTGFTIAAAQIRCEAGNFAGSGRCIPCPAGTFNAASGAITRIVCRRCPENTFSQEGSGACTACPTGLTSTPGSSICLACGPGTRFTPLMDGGRRNREMCQPCPRGFFSNGTANLNCDACPAQLTGPTMATSEDTCRTCPPGRRAGRGGCVACPSNTFKPGRLGGCRSCPSGSISPRGATSCTPCPKGTRAPKFRDRCVDCPVGTTTAAEGGIICRAEGEPCPQNSLEDSVGNCQRCASSSFFNTSTRTCEECPPGSTSRGRLETKCQVCPPGARPNIELEGACICDDGMALTREGACQKCPPGSFSRSNFLTSIGRDVVVLCTECPPGTFQDEAGASDCKPCPSDSIATERGASKCERCPRGLVPSFGARFSEEQNNILCVLPTTGCPPGFRRNPRPVGVLRFDTMLFGCDRIPCLSDTPPEEIGKTCAPCLPGSVPNARGTRCTRCALDEFSSGLACTKCPDGMIQDILDGSKCSCRRFGFGIQDGVCSRCRRGTVSDRLSETCEACPAGTESSGATNCIACRRGFFAPTAGSRRCRQCPSGTFSSPFPRGTRCVRL